MQRPLFRLFSLALGLTLALTAALAVAIPAAASVAGPNSTPTETTAQQEELGSIRGTVADEEGNRRAAVTVLLPDLDLHTVTSLRGTFEIDGVAAGEQRVQAYLDSGNVLAEETVVVRQGQTTDLELRLNLPAISLDEIVVVSKFSMLREEPVVGVGLDREQIAILPHFGDDFYHAVKVLPGTSGNDFVAGFNVRGGFHREVLVRIDGLEIFEPFHLKDFQGLFSILDPQVIGGIELLPGAFPAEYGDRSAGVFDMTTLRPSARRNQLGISFSNAWFGSAGQFAEGRGSWLASARRGYLDLILGAAEGDEDEEQVSPVYWDAFGKLEYQLADSQTLSFNVLVADDKLDFSEVDGAEDVDVESRYGTSYVWLRLQSLLGSKSFVDTFAYSGRVEGDRHVLATDIGERFFQENRRELDILGLRQDWNFELSRHHYLKAGFELRSYDALYVYLDNLVRNDFINDPRFRGPRRATTFEDRFRNEQYGIWISDRVRLGSRFTAELGVRYDRQDLTGDDQTSPRVNLLYETGRAGALRLGWGHFFQSQRPHELQVEFGETEFQPAARAEHMSLGWEVEVGGLGLLRVEAYRREEDDPQRRYETLFDLFQPIPQINLDIVQIAPQSVRSEGVEFYLRGRHTRRFDWWVGYTYSSVVDVVEAPGGRTRDQPRLIDQPHAINTSLTYHPGRKWTYTGVLRYHTGWPTTAVSAEALSPTGDVLDYDVGPFYEERLDDYLSLDMRISRRTEIGRGSLTFFIDIQNLLNRVNERGLDLDERRDITLVGDRLLVSFETTEWLPILPTFGISWEF